MTLALRHNRDFLEQVIGELVVVQHTHVQLTSLGSLNTSIIRSLLAHLKFFQDMHDKLLVVCVKLAYTLSSNSIKRNTMLTVTFIHIHNLLANEQLEVVHHKLVLKNNILKNGFGQFNHEDFTRLIDQFIFASAKIAISHRLGVIII